MHVSVGIPFDAALITHMGVTGLGARVEVPVTRAIVSAWQPAVRDVISGEWVVTLDGPLTAGEYQLVWRSGDPEPPAYEAFVPLTATGVIL